MSTKKKALQAAAGAGGDIGAWDLSYAYYDDPLAWDLSTAVYSGKSFSVATQDTSPYGLFFKPDGTKMYVVGQVGQDVNEYDLSTPWDVSTSSYLQNFSVATEESGPNGISFKPDGTKMYIIGVTGVEVNEYDLSTPWDVSTASYLQNLSLSAQDTAPVGIFFRPDGTKMYFVGFTGQDVNEYDLSTPWDISTASYLQNFSVAAQDTQPISPFFKSDGTKMYIVGFAGDDINEYDLSTPWDVSTASYVQNFSVAGQERQPRSIFFDSNGGHLYVVGSEIDTVYQYSLGGFSVAAQETSPQGLFFKSDGTKMYVSGIDGDDVNEYDLSTPWDTSTASFLQNFSVSTQDNQPRNIFFKPDGTKMYVIGEAGDDVNEYDLSTPWDISSASYLQNFSVAAQETTPLGLFFKPDGTKMYVSGNSGDDVNEYDLSTPWDVSTASYLQNFSVAAQDTAPTGLSFKPDGTKMYVTGSIGDDVNEYDLSTPWDISSASYLQNFSVAAQETTPLGLFFKPDGTKMYVIGQTTDRIFTYTLGPQP